jgi:SAM-dependent methyltransferase
MKLNLGCGSQTPEGWINVDYAFGARLVSIPLFSAINRKVRIFKTDWNGAIVIHDLRKRFPWENDTADVIYSSHTLEHLTREEGRHFIMECWRVLKQSGIIRIIVPDLRAIVSAYLQGEILADDFVLKLDVMHGMDSGGLLRRALTPFVSFPHKCMYDEKRLIAIMRETGFRVESKRPFESAILNIREIEAEDRTIDAVIVEGVKT